MPKEKCEYADCKKKLSVVELSIGKCRCEKIFCNKHRLCEKHDCNYNFALNKDNFIKSNLCIKSKIEYLTTN
tara:strand:- start:1788 stop:2003 length:216 start_codon:yes stop_codon:yes gene_type:complete